MLSDTMVRLHLVAGKCRTLMTSTGQVTLIPPENSGRIRKARKKKSNLRLQGQQLDEVRSSSGSPSSRELRSPHALSPRRPALLHSPRSEIGTSSTMRSHETTCARRSLRTPEGEPFVTPTHGIMTPMHAKISKSPTFHLLPLRKQFL
jgi:hypothetical protein